MATGASNDGEHLSSKYSNSLDKGIKADANIQIGFAEKYKNANNIVKSVDKDNGGGFTSKVSGDKVIIRISGNSVKFPTIGGASATDGPEDILRHEIVGHAVPLLEGSPRANAVDLDNETRMESGTPLLQGDSKHTADWW